MAVLPERRVESHENRRALLARDGEFLLNQERHDAAIVIEQDPGERVDGGARQFIDVRLDRWPSWGPREEGLLSPMAGGPREPEDELDGDRLANEEGSFGGAH